MSAFLKESIKCHFQSGTSCSNLMIAKVEEHFENPHGLVKAPGPC